MPRTACLVVCGLSLVMSILLPTSALVSVDLPALGRPTKQQKPERNVTGPSFQTPPRQNALVTPRTIGYGTHPAQFGELSLPTHASAGTVVIIHGGFWRARYDLSLG